MKYFLGLLCVVSLATSCAKKAGAGAFGGKAYTAQELGTRTFYPTLQDAGPCTLNEEGRLILIGAAGGTRLPHECKDQEWTPVVTTGSGVITREIGAQGDKGEAGKDGTPDTETAENRRLSEVALAGSEQAKRDAEQAKRHAEQAKLDSVAAAGGAAGHAATIAGHAAAAATAAATSRSLATAPHQVEKDELVPAGGRIAFDLSTAGAGSNEEKFLLATENSHGTHMIAHAEGAVYDPRFETLPITPAHFIAAADFPDFFLGSQSLFKDKASGPVEVLRKGNHYFILYRDFRKSLKFYSTNLFFGEAQPYPFISADAEDTYRLTEEGNNVYAVGIHNTGNLHPSLYEIHTVSIDETAMALRAPHPPVLLSHISDADQSMHKPEILDIAAINAHTRVGLIRIGGTARLINIADNTDRGARPIRVGVPYENYQVDATNQISNRGACFGNMQAGVGISLYFVRTLIPMVPAAAGGWFVGAAVPAVPQKDFVLQQLPIAFHVPHMIPAANTAGAERNFEYLPAAGAAQSLENVTQLHCTKDNGAVLLSITQQDAAYLVETDWNHAPHAPPVWKPKIDLTLGTLFERNTPLAAGMVDFVPSRAGSMFTPYEGYGFFQPERNYWGFQTRGNWANANLTNRKIENQDLDNPLKADANFHIKIVSMPQHASATEEYPFVNMIWTHGTDKKVYVRRIPIQQMHFPGADPAVDIQVHQNPGTWNWEMHNPYPFPLRMKITLTR